MRPEPEIARLRHMVLAAAVRRSWTTVGVLIALITRGHRLQAHHLLITLDRKHPESTR